MESSFGHDFSKVRVHNGDEASSMAQRMQARAYTVGHDIVLGTAVTVTGGTGRQLLAHELAHVVQYDLSGRAVLARQTPPTAPAPTRAVSHYEETPLPGGRVRIRAWGKVGDPIDRPGLEKKYPEPGKVGLAGHDRWHLAGPNATGAEEGIAYAPKNFNISKTAEVENVIRRARTAVQEQGGEVFFDFEAECLIVGEHEGVSIRVVESAHWQAEVRPSGSNRFVPILDERATVPTTPPPTTPPPTTPPPSGGAKPAPKAAAAITPPATTTAPSEEAPHISEAAETPPAPKVVAAPPAPKAAPTAEEFPVSSPSVSGAAAEEESGMLRSEMSVLETEEEEAEEQRMMDESGAEGGMGEHFFEPDPLAHAILIINLMSAAEEAHAQLLDREAKIARDAALKGASAVARTVAMLSPGKPLWLNLTLRAHETIIGGWIGMLTGGPDVPDEAKVEIFSFSIDTKARPVQAAEIDWHRGFFRSTRVMEWTEAIPLHLQTH